MFVNMNAGLVYTACISSVNCDVFRENLPYGGTNNVILDQLFVIVFIVKSSRGATKMFAVDVHEQQISLGV